MNHDRCHSILTVYLDWRGNFEAFLQTSRLACRLAIRTGIRNGDFFNSFRPCVRNSNFYRKAIHRSNIGLQRIHIVNAHFFLCNIGKDKEWLVQAIRNIRFAHRDTRERDVVCNKGLIWSSARLVIGWKSALANKRVHCNFCISVRTFSRVRFGSSERNHFINLRSAFIGSTFSYVMNSKHRNTFIFQDLRDRKHHIVHILLQDLNGIGIERV